MKLLLFFLLATSAPAFAQTFKASQVVYQDCFVTGCGGKVQDGDTTIFQAWASSGFHTINGVTITGELYGTTNDSNIYYNADSALGPNCYGRSIQWLRIPAVKMVGSGGIIYSNNCMTSYSDVPGDLDWPPATAGTCYSGDVGGGGGTPSGCDWKSQGMICVDGVCYLNVLRQGRASSVHPFRGYDSTLIKTSNKGTSWLNPAHVGGSPNVNGDAPAGPGDATYPASIIWPDQSPHSGASQKIARLEFIQYGRDGATWPSADNNATYIYALAYSGDFANLYLARVVRANMANLSASDWSYYKCATYPTTVCDGSVGGSWDSTPANATAITPSTGFGLGGAMYSSDLGVYITTGGNINKVAINTAPHPWGPWTSAGSLAYAPVPGANLGFVSPLISSIIVTNAGRSIQFIVSATEYNHVSGSGTPAYVTYELVKIGGAGGGSGSSTSLFPLPMPIYNPASGDFVTDINVTNTQAVMSYTSPVPGSACYWEVSESSSYRPLVHDVDTALFSGADSDGGSTASRTFVIGKRVTETALDSDNYSRALQANTTHYFRVTCGPSVATGVFITGNIPFNATYQDIPQTDQANPGSTIMPTLSTTDRAQTIVDPHTGSLIRRFSLPADTVSDGGGGTGPFMYFSGFTRVCGETLIGPGPGYLCSFAQGDGGQGVLYYYIPSTKEVRYLGRNSWGAAYAFINATNSKFYEASTGSIKAYTYTGAYTAVASGTVASFSNTTVLSNLATAIQTFDAGFDPTYFTCSGIASVGDYFDVQCKRSIQDTYGWLAAVKISTGTVVGATRVDSNIKTRWCGIHQTLPLYTSPAIVLTTHGMNGADTPTAGTGPYINTYAGGVTLGTGDTALAVSGEPACAACGSDPALALAQVGDTFQFSDGGGEKITITAKTDANNWTISRASRGTTAATHAPGATLTADCSYTPVYWKFLADPHGTDTTNTNYILDTNWPVSGHDDHDTDLRMTENSGWELKLGDLMTGLGTAATRTISSSATFAGVQAQCFGNGCLLHPSVGKNQIWVTDYASWDGAYTSPGFNHLVLQSGQLYKYITGNATVVKPKHYAIAAAQFANYLDVSGPGVTLSTGAGDSYKYCIANAANECKSGSSAGEIYVNLPGSPPTDCRENSPCIVSMPAYAQGVVQIGTSGTQSRVVTNGLTGLRENNDFPSARPLADASALLFTLGKTTTQSYILMAMLPPFTFNDNVTRNTFVRAPVSITTPTGLGITTAVVEFGYREQGTVAQHYCTSRREACVAVASAITEATPFYYTGTDTYTRLSCATSCTIGIPVLPSHVAHYTVKFYNAGGAFVQDGTSGVTIEGTVK